MRLTVRFSNSGEVSRSNEVNAPKQKPPGAVNVADQLLSASSGACRSARRSCRSARRSCRFSTRAWWPTQAEKNVQAAVAAKVSRSVRAIRKVGIEESFIQSNSRLIEEFLASAVRPKRILLISDQLPTRFNCSHQRKLMCPP